MTVSPFLNSKKYVYLNIIVWQVLCDIIPRKKPISTIRGSGTAEEFVYNQTYFDLFLFCAFYHVRCFEALE